METSSIIAIVSLIFTIPSFILAIISLVNMRKTKIKNDEQDRELKKYNDEIKNLKEVQNELFKENNKINSTISLTLKSIAENMTYETHNDSKLEKLRDFEKNEVYNKFKNKEEYFKNES